jgi:hypothetical protein
VGVRQRLAPLFCGLFPRLLVGQPLTKRRNQLAKMGPLCGAHPARSSCSPSAHFVRSSCPRRAHPQRSCSRPAAPAGYAVSCLSDARLIHGRGAGMTARHDVERTSCVSSRRDETKLPVRAGKKTSRPVLPLSLLIEEYARDLRRRDIQPKTILDYTSVLSWVCRIWEKQLGRPPTLDDFTVARAEAFLDYLLEHGKDPARTAWRTGPSTRRRRCGRMSGRSRSSRPG